MKTLKRIESKVVRGGGIEMVFIALAPILANLQTVMNTLNPDKNLKEASKADAKAAVGKESEGEKSARQAASS